MKYWKRFVEWAIALKADPFTWARLKFTILFTFVIASILIVYLPLLNIEFNRNIINFARNEIHEQDKRERFIRRSSKVISKTLFGVEPEDVVILVISTIASYFLATLVLRPIEKSTQLQRQFVANASHELKTPLAIIKTEMEVFLRSKNYFQNNREILLRRRQSVRSNLEEVDRINRIIEDLLMLTRIDTHYEKFKYSKVNLNALMSHVARRMAQIANTKRVKISIHGREPTFISADAEKLHEAFSNILKNAIIYSNIKGSVHITVSKAGNKAQVTFIDNGVGISKKDLSHIFERFFRSAKSSSEVSGSGLGLFIAKWIISNHAGDIKVTSTPNKGTTVNVLLPLAITS